MDELERIPLFIESFKLPNFVTPPSSGSRSFVVEEEEEEDSDNSFWEVLPGVINAGAGLFGVIMQNRKTGENEFIPSSAPLHASPPKDYGFLLFPIIAASALIALYILKNKS